MFDIQLPQFEGPLELLLELIEKEKLSINDISLSQIANQYIEKIRSRGNFPAQEVADFIVIAATLMLIKSRTLLPSLELTAEEEGDINELTKRLAIYAQIRLSALVLQKIFGKNILFPKDPFKNYRVDFRPPRIGEKTANLKDFASAIKEIVAEAPIKAELPEASVRTVVSLEEKILEIMKRVTEKLEMSFAELSGHGLNKSVLEEERVHIIVSFLAILELAKQGIIMVRQDAPFEDINLRHGKLV